MNLLQWERSVGGAYEGKWAGRSADCRVVADGNSSGPGDKRRALPGFLAGELRGWSAAVVHVPKGGEELEPVLVGGVDRGEFAYTSLGGNEPGIEVAMSGKKEFDVR